jgi:beta-N-acetylhexosaminidase
VTDESRLDRRGALKALLVLGAAAPLAGACARSAQAVALTSRQVAGQRVIYSYSGLTVPSALLQQIQSGQAAGVIFFRGNISSEAQITSVIRKLRQAQRQSPVSSPLLLMTDQEGGLVRRLPGAPRCRRSRSARRRTRPRRPARPGPGPGITWPAWA